MGKDQSGVMVMEVARFGACYGLLETSDVILSVDDTPIGNDCTVVLRHKERINWVYQVTSRLKGTTK